MNVSELTIPQLNHFVAKSLGWEQRLWGAIPVWFDPANENRYRCHVSQWNPSENWAQGGPIIESADISLDTLLTGNNRKAACISGKFYAGPTCLIAAMRAFVASRFGEEVPSHD